MGSGVLKMQVGSFDGTGANVDVDTVGFRPRRVEIHNREGLASLTWQNTMPDASGVKCVTDGTMSYISTLGVTPRAGGFRLGTDADMNVSGEECHWVAWE